MARDQQAENLVWTMESPPGPEVVLNGQKYLYFAGTSYLGLQGHGALVAAARQAADQYGVHTATTRSGFGTSPPVAEVEQRAAQFLGSESALYLVTGYAGNFAIAAALADRVDVVLVDEHAHDCLRESTRWLDRLAKPPLVFRHRDAEHVRQLLRAQVSSGQRPLVMTDGVFPVSGALAPLADYLEILREYSEAMLLVDEAHALAVLGRQGRGSLELAGVAAEQVNCDLDQPASGPRVFATATLSKAVGGHGGIIAGTSTFLDRVRRSSGWFRGSSAPAAPVAAATAKGLEIVAAEPELRRRLADNVARLRSSLAALDLPVESSPAPIIGLLLETAERMQRVQRRMLDEGIVIAYAREYAGAGERGVLRLAVFANHNPAMLERLVETLSRALQAERPEK